MKKKYIVRQHDIRDCGACSLLSIIRYYDGNIPLEKIKLDTRTSKEGTTAYNIINAAKKYGFISLGKKVENIEDIEYFPVIAHVTLDNGLNHFVVIYKYDKKYVYIMDPAKGYKKEEISSFLKIWNSIILIFKPYQVIPNYKDNNYFKDFIINTLSKEKRLIKSIVFCSILLSFLSILLSFYIQITLSFSNKMIILNIFLVFFFLTILKLILSYKRNYYINILNKDIDESTVIPFIKHIINLPLNIIKSRTPGDILTKVNELNNIKMLFSDVFISIILEGILSICSMIALFMISKEMFLVLFILMFIYCIVAIIYTPFIHKRVNNNIDLETDFNSLLVERLSALDSIKNLNIVEDSYNYIRRSFMNLLNDSYDLNKSLNYINSIKSIIFEFTLFFINSLGFILILNNKISILSLITFNSIIVYYMRPIENIILLLPKISLIRLSMDKVREILALKEEDIGNEERFINGDIIFSNVSYSYDDYHNIIDNMNIKIDKSSKIIIKGPTGAGKSTMCKLLNGTINNYEGNISINGINIKDYSLATIKKNIRYVSQKERLFTDSILNNITLGKEYDKNELNKVLSITKVDELLNNKQFRLNTPLLDSGSNLSGGERQRIILSRSIINKPNILILDESLSEIDKDLEKIILNNIVDYLKDSTIIYITHHNEINNFKLLDIFKKNQIN